MLHPGTAVPPGAHGGRGGGEGLPLALSPVRPWADFVAVSGRFPPKVLPFPTRSSEGKARSCRLWGWVSPMPGEKGEEAGPGESQSRGKEESFPVVIIGKFQVQRNGSRKASAALPPSDIHPADRLPATRESSFWKGSQGAKAALVQLALLNHGAVSLLSCHLARVFSKSAVRIIKNMSELTG